MNPMTGAFAGQISCHHCLTQTNPEPDSSFRS
jgi:hypothetical protein